MHNFGIQLEDLERDDSLEGKIFELYNKTPGREFKSHVQFIKAECLRDAEDAAIEVDPDYALPYEILARYYQNRDQERYAYYLGHLSRLGVPAP